MWGDVCFRPAAGSGIGVVCGCVRAVVGVLGALVSSLAGVMCFARIRVFVILGGTLLPVGRGAADTLCWSG